MSSKTKSLAAIEAMSANCEFFIAMVLRGAWFSALRILANLQPREIFRALAVIDRSDLVNLRDFCACSGCPVGETDLILLKYAIATVERSKIRQQPAPPKIISGNLNTHRRLADFVRGAGDYIHSVVLLKQTPLVFLRDLTRTLPDKASNLASLSDADLQKAADALGVELEVIKAVATVESNRDGFEDGKRPTLRYELHQFDHRTHSAYLNSHPWLAQSGWKGGPQYHAHGQVGEYSMLYNAMILGGPKRNIAEAISSCSWGRFQVMGFNYRTGGWSDPVAFASDMFESEAKQLKAFVGYVSSLGLQSKLKTHDWVGFAQGYNGDGQAQRYGGLVESSYNSFVKQSNAKSREVGAGAR